MLKLILKLRALYKMFNFTPKGDLLISYSGSHILLTKEGDICVNAKRNLVHNYRLLFQGCEPQFIEKMTKADLDGKVKEILEEETDKQILEKGREICQLKP